MDETQPSSERNEDKKRKLWTYATLGLIFGTLFLLGKRYIEKQGERASEESVSTSDMSLSGIKAQLDRVEQTVQKTAISAVRLWILAVAIALIIATPTIITNNLKLALLMFLLGTGLIFIAALYKRKQII